MKNNIIIAFVIGIICIGVVMLFMPSKKDVNISSVGQKTGIKKITQPKAPEKEISAPKPAVIKAKDTAIPELKITPVPTPQSLHVVMGMGEENNYFVRIKEVHQLGKDLTHDEIQTLYALLNRKKGEDALPLEQLNALKNDIVNVLKRQNIKPADLANNLMAMYYDSGHDNVWRDYCIQHLGGLYKEGDSRENAQEAQKVVEEKAAIAQTLWKATEETGGSIAGTALIALANNCGQPGIKKNDVSAKALELSTSPKCGELAKITAIQICAILDEKKVLPTARQIAESSSSVPLRMSAIAAVGTLGDESDRSMLEKYASSSDVRLRKSAQSALKRFKKRLGIEG